MIRLQKGKKPAVLEKEAASWTKELLGLIRAGKPVPPTKLRRYAHPTIKAAVKQEAYEKCIYCESKISHVAPGDVEHIKPKSRYRELTYDWHNLAYVCNECNRRKSDTYNEACTPLNPFDDDPSKALAGVGAFIFSVLGHDRAEVTVSLMQLNRPALLERRGELITTLKHLAERAFREQNPSLRDLLLRELCREVAAPREYSFAGRSFLNSLGVTCPDV